MKAVVFDFDGTMLDTENLWYTETMNYLKETYDIDLPDEIYQQIIGTSEEPIIRYMMEATNGAFDKEAFLTTVAEACHLGQQSLGFRDGFKEFFEQVKANDYKIGLATSSGFDWIEPTLDRLGILADFETIQTADHVDEIKPHPALYLQAVEALGVKPEEAVAIEDSKNGALSAMQAGLKVYIVPNEATKNITFPKEATVVSSFAEINLK
ncbi:HAD family hydrolase [Listeria monocytogenes]|uniref:HAD family hydrolase n=1 Tax=Listeria monocytogenes TaxID=1639 RepID=UPI0007756DA4|nr:HAD family hydrolase [Listeria monocytogenes]EAF3071868.1 HAD family hydrolase [Listeria monocytogenes serotype 1/2a]EAC2206931.1 HAD family hydrolase [Listeria monocytogenes]EAC3784707.1 HAD family hydrolase [Listeria monocytogenes]EAC5535749.1 HAD family hydrolase [Listeria monocytogenes]EAC5610869.1 HAD family hydrolase [Listeria monocytogenes]